MVSFSLDLDVLHVREQMQLTVRRALLADAASIDGTHHIFGG
jgi:hypothetical protein